MTLGVEYIKPHLATTDQRAIKLQWHQTDQKHTLAPSYDNKTCENSEKDFMGLSQQY